MSEKEHISLLLISSGGTKDLEEPHTPHTFSSKRMWLPQSSDKETHPREQARADLQTWSLGRQLPEDTASAATGLATRWKESGLGKAGARLRATGLLG